MDLELSIAMENQQWADFHIYPYIYIPIDIPLYIGYILESMGLTY